MLQSNTWYAITQTVGCWYEIDLGGLERGYVLSQYIQVQRADASDTRAFGVVANPSYFDRLHLREKPSTSGKSLARFYNGARLEILGDEGDWYRVRVGNLEGYMMKKFVDVVQ